ncbi:molybdate ABC transporter substrate-binding protein [Microbacterium aerolatum]|uniref:Molybdate-binding protein n=1 Tax=Microbacterium aerolatum TaxID=153731 RepID=A0A511AEV8_9MICO|nr:molybdate ABC transporter substrate-binding protein [Microbacterium aerolatum]GEK86695.1 molybdate-binding protein [Microbacterium aerolatum]GGB18979.1 molybdate-binding protein [Microbacterium aerolatum]
MKALGRVALAAPLVGLLLLAGCAAPASDSPAPEAAASEPAGEVTIFAAASLRTAFDDIRAAFTAENPGVTVNPIVYDGSSTLVTQLQEGARADVLATADERNMQDLVDSGLATEPELFATNTLVIAVPVGNPAGVSGLADLADAVTVLCAPAVPCGAASAQLLDAAGVDVTAASLEQNVTAVLQKVAAGEADAGLVYATDVIGDDAVDSVVPDGAEEVVNRYPIVTLAGSDAAGAAFVDFVLSAKGQQIMSDHGFGAP